MRTFIFVSLITVGDCINPEYNFPNKLEEMNRIEAMKTSEQKRESMRKHNSVAFMYAGS